jgi:hypothetical protein
VSIVDNVNTIQLKSRPMLRHHEWVLCIVCKYILNAERLIYIKRTNRIHTVCTLDGEHARETGRKSSVMHNTYIYVLCIAFEIAQHTRTHRENDDRHISKLPGLSVLASVLYVSLVNVYRKKSSIDDSYCFLSCRQHSCVRCTGNIVPAKRRMYASIKRLPQHCRSLALVF